MVSCWKASILIRNLMNNNLDSLEFCYFPIKQKLWNIKVRPLFSSMIHIVGLARVAQFVVLYAAKYEKVLIPTWTSQMQMFAKICI